MSRASGREWPQTVSDASRPPVTKWPPACTAAHSLSAAAAPHTVCGRQRSATAARSLSAVPLCALPAQWAARRPPVTDSSRRPPLLLPRGSPTGAASKSGGLGRESLERERVSRVIGGQTVWLSWRAAEWGHRFRKGPSVSSGLASVCVVQRGKQAVLNWQLLARIPSSTLGPNWPQLAPTSNNCQIISRPASLPVIALDPIGAANWLRRRAADCVIV